MPYKKSNWITPSDLQAALKEGGREVSLQTISTWIRRGLIPSKRIPDSRTRPRFLVDSTKVPDRRPSGRPYSVEGRSGIQMLRETVDFCNERPEPLNEDKSPAKLIDEYSKTIKKKRK